MNQETQWLINDARVEDLRNRMIEAREEFRKDNPQASITAEERYLQRKFSAEAQGLMKGQLAIIGSGLRSKTEKFLY